MDFFESQREARQLSRKLMKLYVLVTIATAVLGGCFIGFFVWIFGLPNILVCVLIGTIIMLGAISGIAIKIYKNFQAQNADTFSLRIISRKIEGKELARGKGKLRNIVEEMAIAAGIAPPKVYVLENEPVINAFSIGQNSASAMLFVTQGSIDQLSRDELQGMIAHEYGHIINGDLELATRVIALTFGFLIPLAASFFLAMPLMIIFGIGLLLIMQINGSMLRQRDYLADAIAVQLTRNPDGIAGAIKKIAPKGSSKITTKISFGAGMFMFGPDNEGFVKAHPSPSNRIARIISGWDGDLTPRRSIPTKGRSVPPPLEALPAPAPAATQQGPSRTEPSWASSPAPAPEPTTIPDPAATSSHHALPPVWLDATREPMHAGTLVLALLLSTDERWTAAQLADITRVSPDLPGTIHQVASAAVALSSAEKLALANLSIPALREIGKDEYIRFRSLSERLIASDGQVDLFELAVGKIFTHSLDSYYHTTPQRSSKPTSRNEVAKAAGLLISMAAHGATDDMDRNQAYIDGLNVFQKRTHIQLPRTPTNHCSIAEISQAIDKIEKAAPDNQAATLEACREALRAQKNNIDDSKTELLYALAGAIDCPIALGLDELLTTS